MCSTTGVAQPVVVNGKDGWRGIIHTWSRGSDEITLRLDSGEKLILPSSVLAPRPDGSYYVPLSMGEIRGGGAAARVPASAPAPAPAQGPAPAQSVETVTNGWEQVIPVIHEELEVGKRKVETGGGVRIQKIAREEEQVVDIPLIEERVEVERVPVDRQVDGPVAVRHVGDTIVVPVVEEVLVVQKQLRLVEELHIHKTRTEKHQPQTIQLRKEEAMVERLEGDSRESGESQGGTDDLRPVR